MKHSRKKSREASTIEGRPRGLHKTSDFGTPVIGARMQKNRMTHTQNLTTIGAGACRLRRGLSEKHGASSP
jgi:hypothetical protein